MTKYILNKDFGKWLHDDIQKDPGNFMYLAQLEKIEEEIESNENDIKEYEENIKEAKGEIKPRDDNPYKSEDLPGLQHELEIYKQQLRDAEKERKRILDFADNYDRLKERYKYEKEILKRIHDDWKEYNLTLYRDWHNFQAFLLGDINQDTQNQRKSEYRKAEIKKEEIERRFKQLLE